MMFLIITEISAIGGAARSLITDKEVFSEFRQNITRGRS